jgi:hypothetical protein
VTTGNQIAALRALESLGTASYSEWKLAAEDVPEGSFGRVVRALVAKNIVEEVEGRYQPASAETDTTTDTDTTATDTADTPTDTNATNRIRKRNTLRAFSLQHGGMVDYSALKGYSDEQK